MWNSVCAVYMEMSQSMWKLFIYICDAWALIPDRMNAEVKRCSSKHNDPLSEIVNTPIGIVDYRQPQIVLGLYEI